MAEKIGINFDGIFTELTCWEIAHHDICKGLFHVVSKTVKDRNSNDTRRVMTLRINTTHIVYKTLMNANGVVHKTKKNTK